MKRTSDAFFLGPVSVEQLDSFSGMFGDKTDAAFSEVFAEAGRNVQVTGITGSDH
jgi:hypothetical protein